MGLNLIIEKLRLLQIITLLILFSINARAEIQIEKFSAESLPTGFHAITAENGFIIVTFPEEKNKWKSHCYSPDGTAKWETDLQIVENEYVIQDELYHGVLNVFSTLKDEKNKTTSLFLRKIDEKTGEFLSKTELWTRNIKEEHFNNDKADVIADENTALVALRNEDVEVHLEYRFNMALSLREEKMLFYHFDYSDPQLKLHYKIFDQHVKELDSGEINLNDGDFIYQVSVNDLGDIFIANSNLTGDMEVYRFPFKSEEFNLLNITAGNSVRDDLTMTFTDDNKLYIAAKSEIDERFHGALYAFMNFESLEIERVHFQPLSDELKDEVDSLHRAGVIPHIVWTKYNLTHMRVFNDHELFLVYEHMEVRHSGHIFREIDFVSRLPWKEHKSKVSVGPALFFSFDSWDNKRWSKYFELERRSDESVFPLSSALFVQEPDGDEITLIISETEKSYTYTMDYIYDRKEQKDEIQESGKIIPSWTVKMDGKYYASYYSDLNKSLIIKEIK